MAGDRWDAVDRIFHDALAQPSSERARFVDEACAGDESLRAEILSLLDHAFDEDPVFDRPAAEHAVRLMAEGPASLIGRQIGDYRVRSLIGRGGMGHVYAARDLRLGRDVALKVAIRSPFSDGPRTRDVEREARAASLLNHPNIVTIYSVGEDGDIGYIAMELVRGRTLRDVAAERTFSLDESLAMAQQLASALSAAHASGIVHRDLKPDNIMVTVDGRLKVLDFGIASRHSDAPGVEAAGVMPAMPLVGTAAYMAPEQARGLPAGAAADQFAFGLIIYELLAGRRAMAGDSTTATLRAAASDGPLPLPPLPPGTPEDLAALLRRCLDKSPERRFPSMDAVAAALAGIVEARRGRGLTRRQVLWAGAAASMAAAAGFGWTHASRPPAIGSIAVLSLDGPRDDDGLAYLKDGLPRTLRDRLADLDSVRVAPLVRLPPADTTTARVDAIRALGVDAVVAGELSRKNGTITLRMDMQDARRGVVVWSSRYQVGSGGIKRLRDRIAEDLVTHALGVDRSDANAGSLRSETASPEAFDLYLRACYFHQLGGEDDLIEERELLTRAIALDPTFARAFVALASTHSVLALEGFEPPSAAFPETNRYLRRALAIDPDLADAYGESASYQFLCNWAWADADHAWAEAEARSRGGLQPDLLIARALQRWALGHADEALALARRARAFDRLSPSFMINEADYLLQLGRLDEAAALYASATRADPDDPRGVFGSAAVFKAQRRFDDAIAMLRRAHAMEEDDLPAAVASRARGEAGLAALERAGAEEELRRLERRAALQYVSPMDLARVHARLGHAREMFDLLGRALDEHAPGLVFLNVDRSWSAWRDTPDFQRVARTVGLPPLS